MVFVSFMKNSCAKVIWLIVSATSSDISSAICRCWLATQAIKPIQATTNRARMTASRRIPTLRSLIFFMCRVLVGLSIKLVPFGQACPGAVPSGVILRRQTRIHYAERHSFAANYFRNAVQTMPTPVTRRSATSNGVTGRPQAARLSSSCLLFIRSDARIASAMANGSIVERLISA